ncbi:hypothetical protein MGWOODY_Smn3013 [hydrothermal vent metagenome]|jgi:hypothetical protein|uniref:Uncharacterized protein n=1 Tax=hydrothermal vent metagenome TaxID=652676 RepID=A0A160TIH3_9ZZZZ
MPAPGMVDPALILGHDSIRQVSAMRACGNPARRDGTPRPTFLESEH